VTLLITSEAVATLKEEHRLKEFENRVAWGIYGPKKKERKGMLKEITQRGIS
jgi:hypothetical protein